MDAGPESRDCLLVDKWGEPRFLIVLSDVEQDGVGPDVDGGNQFGLRFDA